MPLRTREAQKVHGLLAELSHAAERMISFLGDIVHPDGEIPFFNDAAIGIAPSPKALFEYAGRLGVPVRLAEATGVSRAIAKPQFGLYVLDGSTGRMIIDAGAIGPDYLPGHAHCDTLSYELSVNGRRFLVNSGTYEYAGARRNRYRATAAHNTLRLDGQEQHEIWSTFRVARRGYPIGTELIERVDGWEFRAGHTGYRRLPGKPTHWRQVISTPAVWIITDKVEGAGSHRAEVFLHLHPDVEIESFTARLVICRIGARKIRVGAGHGLTFRSEPYHYSPEFGLAAEGLVLILEASGDLPLVLEHRIEMG